MGKETAISWTDHTFNPWEGCRAKSPGCANCYAKAMIERFGKNFGIRRRTGNANWKLPLKWNRLAICDTCGASLERGGFIGGRIEEGTAWCMDCGNGRMRRPRVFCASLADWLDDEAPIEWLADLLDLIRRTPNLDWLLLTKRPENWRERIGKAARHIRESGGDMTMLCAWGHQQPPANVWIGATVENQEMAEKRIAELDAIPARVRFLSCEPLLGPVNLSLRTDRIELPDCIHWVICGGESGPGFRPFNPDWARSLRDQCKAAGIAFHMKQMGGLKPSMMPPIPDDLMIREWPDGKEATP